MGFTRRHLDRKLPTIVDPRVKMPPNLTYGNLIDCVPSHRCPDMKISLEAAWVRQVAHFLVWPISQSQIIAI
jgi:hypothetical protein